MIEATITGSAVPTTAWLTEYQADHGLIKTRICQMAIDGRTPKEIAAAIGWLPASVTSRFARARRAGMEIHRCPPGRLRTRSAL
jgi:hypothetical protein